jgi:cholesterol transport system auxiliary component
VNQRSKPFALLAGLAMLAALGGCASWLHSNAKATQVYVLRAASVPQADLSRPVADASLHVGRPIAGPGLDSDHIVLVQSDHRMSYFLASRWPTDLPALVESLAADSLRATGAWATVQDSASAFSADYMLQIVIRRFEADYSDNPAAPVIHVVFDCTVGRRAGREVLASFVAEGSSAAAANRLTDVVAAFEEASNKALGAIAVRTSQAVQGVSEHKPPQRD